MPPAKVEVPAPAEIIRSAVTVEEARKAPLTCSDPATVEEAEEINPLPMVSMPVVEALANRESPETVRLVKVPTLVSEEPVTLEPNAVADKVFTPLMARKFPVARFMEPETYNVVEVALVVVDILISRFWEVEEA